jgi:hypothetical protein
VTRNLESALHHIQARLFGDFQEKDNIENRGAEPRLVAIGLMQYALIKLLTRRKISKSL